MSIKCLKNICHEIFQSAILSESITALFNFILLNIIMISLMRPKRGTINLQPRIKKNA